MGIKSTSCESDNSARLIYSDSVSNADLLYLTGLITEDPFLWFSVDGCNHVMISDLEINRARRSLPASTRLLGFAEARKQWDMEEGKRGIVDYITAMASAFDKKEWEVPAGFPLRLAFGLQERGLTLTTAEEFCRERVSKTPEEVEQVRLGVRLAEHGFYHALDILTQSTVNSDGYLEWCGSTLTSEHLRGEINAEVVRCGGLAYRTIVAAGVQSADPHEIGHGPIPADQPVIIDIFPRVEISGYYGDFTRTVVKGKAAEVVQKAFAAVKSARETGMAALKSGTSASLPHQLADKVLREQGFITDVSQRCPRGFFHGLGHGLGLEIHERPRLNSSTDEILQAGNIVTIEPGIYYPEWGGVRLEDVAVVTDNGCDNLTMAPSFLEIT